MKSCRKGLVVSMFYVLKNKNYPASWFSHHGTKSAAAKKAQLMANETGDDWFIGRADSRRSVDIQVIGTKLPKYRKTNPTSTATLSEDWEPCHAVRKLADGTVQILREKNSGRQKNISEGFMAGGVFHPIRHAGDYDPSRVGESRAYKKRRKKGSKPQSTGRRYAPKKASTKKAMPISRREYGGDGSRYRNPAKKPTKAQVNAAWRKYDAYIRQSEKTGRYSELYANQLMLEAQLLQKEYQDFR